MPNTELVKLLNPFISDLNNSGLSNLSCMKRHIALLLSLRNTGYKVQQIIDASEISYSKAVFCSKLNQCKKAYISKLESETIAIKEPLSKSPSPISSYYPPKAVDIIVDDNASTELIHSLDEWIAATRLGKGNIDLFQQGEMDGLTPSDFNDLASYNSLTVINIFSGWEDILEDTIIDESKKPTKEQYLSTYKR